MLIGVDSGVVLSKLGLSFLLLCPNWGFRHVGTHQSRGFYGIPNSTRVITAQTGGPAGRQTEVTGSSFGALVSNAVIARDMVRGYSATFPEISAHWHIILEQLMFFLKPFPSGVPHHRAPFNSLYRCRASCLWEAD